MPTLTNLFHVTPTSNIDSILATGVDPARATGRLKASWWVTVVQLDWAIAHVSLKHKIPVSELVVFSVVASTDLAPGAWLRTSWPHVFRCSETIKVSNYRTTEYVLGSTDENDEGVR